MNRFEVFKRLAWSVLIAGMLAFTVSGCDGDDGRDGADGANGAPGAPGQDGQDGQDGTSAPVTALESCEVCHSDGSYVSAPAAHALPPIESYSIVGFAENGADLEVTFDLTVDDAPGLGYDQVQRGYRTDGTTRTSISDSLTLTDNGGGNYTITIAGGAAQAAIDNRYLFRVAAGSDRETRLYLYGDYPASPVEDLAITAESCEGCHGPEGIGVHGGYFAAEDGGEPCLACHGLERPPRDPIPPLFEVAHGYHSGIWVEDGEVVDVTYPTYMNNCSVCHSEGAELTAANSMAVEADNCFSCHVSTATMFAPDDPLYVGIHDGFTDFCESCHVDGQIGQAYQVVTDVHNGAVTERDGVIWDGVDTSVTEGAKFDWRITGVTDDGTDLTITWEASYGGIAFSPCNADPAAGPVFFADADPDAVPPFEPDNLSIIRNYAQGEDFILGTRANRVGQPLSTPAVSDANTTCDSGGAGFVATTVVPVEPTTAMYGRVAIQGKPRILNVDPTPDAVFAGEYGTTMPVRAKTPTYDWVVGVGGPAPARRAIADTSLCLNCHVGSLYQHGGNRVDNIDMCMLCHNSAANDEYVRVRTFGVDASEAYDGRAGQSFGIKEMVHAVHPAGAFANPLVIYRGRGIYGWAADVSQLSNWPLVDDCVRSNGLPGRLVVGADDPAAPSACQPHNFHVPTYPRGLYDCAACHVQDDPLTVDTDETFVEFFPDPTKAMATTVEAGAQPFEDQVNDVLQGVQTSSCISCHADTATTAHGWQNSWVPQEFPEGRQSIIDAN